MDRDGFQGWSRAAESAWLRVFGKTEHACTDPPDSNEPGVAGLEFLIQQQNAERMEYCNNKYETPGKERCWYDDEAVSTQAAAHGEQENV